MCLERKLWSLDLGKNSFYCFTAKWDAEAHSVWLPERAERGFLAAVKTYQLWKASAVVTSCTFSSLSYLADISPPA